MKVIETKSLEIDSTLFTLFNSFRSEAVGQSITFTMSLPLSHTIKFNDITVRWTNSLFDQTTYEGYLDSSDTVLVMPSPISLYPSIIDIHGSTFYKCANSLHGGIVNSNLNCIINLYSSTFTENWASEGGAMYISQTKLTITNTQFRYNYWIKGGAIFEDSNLLFQHLMEQP